MKSPQKWTKKLFVSNIIKPKPFEELKKFFQKDNIDLVKIEDDSVESLLKTSNSFRLNLFLLVEGDNLLKKNSNFWKNLKSLSPFLIVPISYNDNFFDTHKNLNCPKELCHNYLTIPLHLKNLELTINAGFQRLIVNQEKIKLQSKLKDRSNEIQELTNIGKALSTEKNYGKLLDYILRKGKEITNSDAATIYLIEKNERNEKMLRFKLSDLELDQEESIMPLNKQSIAGYAALTEKTLNIQDAYHIPRDAEYTLNLGYDKKYNYRTKSILVVPMKDHKDEIIGVLQLINKKKNKKTILNTIESMEKEVISFDEHDVELASSIAGQSAVAIESSKLAQQSKVIQELTEIGKALATERNHTKLLRVILEKGKQITNSDAGSIYLVKEDENMGKCLSFNISDLMLHEKEFTFPINKKSIAGYVALTGETLNLNDAYHLPETAEYKINLEYDKEHNYRTKSMLVVPMTNQKNEVIGILQLINKRKDQDTLITTVESVEENVISYDANDIDLVISVAGQAAVSIENNILYQSIENLFEGFVKASVTAIESRDPTTSGHSERVAIYTVELAKVVDGANKGKWKDVTFNFDQIKEIRYASLLHDFGKVGVKEKVLLKAQKLYPEELEIIKNRFDFIKRTSQYESSQKKIQYLLEKSREEALELMQKEDKHFTRELKKIDKALQSIIQFNKPLVLEGEHDKMISEIAKRTYQDINDQSVYYLTQDETNSLSIGKGSLGVLERREIESHVAHTFEFLSNIPWTDELMKIPNIAYAHHEKLNGDGYPNQLTEDNIPIQSKLMTVSDIYDALAATDRPYKKALPPKKALEILEFEVKDSHLDAELVNFFIDAKIYNSISKKLRSIV